MAKRIKGSIANNLKKGISAVSNVIGSSVSTKMKEKVDDVMDRIESRVATFQDRIIRRIAAVLIMGYSLIFLTFAVFFFLREYANLNNTLSFLIVGIIILITGIVMRIYERG